MSLMGLQSREGVGPLCEQKSPILLLCMLHKAIRSEVDVLHQLSMACASGQHDNIIQLLFQQFCLFGSIYKHHLSAKDEVIFVALDTSEKNIAKTYFIRHKDENNVFNKMFEQLNSMLIYNQQGSLQSELDTFFGALRLLVTNNLAKEEDQVFPLMNEEFSVEYQASLMCQFLCSIPTSVLSKLLSWLPHSISTEEYQDLRKCLIQMLPHQKLLQQAIFNWIDGVNHTFDHCSMTHQLELNALNPIDEVLLWHIAIKRELNETFEKVKRIYISGNFSELSAFLKDLQFIAKICIFHSIVEDKVMLPAVYGEASFFSEHAHEVEGQFKEFMHLVQSATKLSAPSSTEFYAKLCIQADKIMHTMNMNFDIEKDQVLPFARKHFDANKQLELLYQSFCLMPLKLIERVLPWLVQTLDHEKAMYILNNLKLAAPTRDIALVTLFSDWANKESNMQSLCQSSCETSFSPINTSTHIVDDFTLSFFAFSSASSSQEIFLKFLKDINALKPLRTELTDSGFQALNNNNKNLTSSSCSAIAMTPLNYGLCGPLEQPIDIIYNFHKAIRRDLEYIDVESGKIGSDGDENFLEQFIGRFYLSWVLYRNHSNAEDNILYPVLESKQELKNVTSSYTLDHEQEERMFKDISTMLSELSRIQATMIVDIGSLVSEFGELASKVKAMCKSMRIMVEQHMFREEMELLPLFCTQFSMEQQYKMVGFVLGTMSAEVLQSLLPWLFSALSEDEQGKMMNTLKKVTKNTMFDEWLDECWKGTSKSILQQKILKTNASLEGVQFYGNMDQSDILFKPIENGNFHVNQNELKLENMKVYLDSNSNTSGKARMLKYHMSRHWIAAVGEQRKAEERRENKDRIIVGRLASYRDVGNKVLGCEHYKRNCKILASCCGKLFTCRFCHDSVSDHSMDWKTTIEMMCMRCLNIQPIGPICITPSCNKFPMANYFCNICKLFDDERNIYHCPFCNICRVGRGLGMDYFHCMSCNCCLCMNLVKHTCKKKCLETNCPVCNEFLFTSSSTIRALPCGHYIHSACLRASTFSHYTCLICNQSSMEPTQSSSVLANGKEMVFYKCGDDKTHDMETTSSNSSSESSSLGHARIWATKLSSFLLGFDSPICKSRRLKTIMKVLDNLDEGHTSNKDSCLLFCLLMSSLVVLCIITVTVVFIWQKIVGDNKFYINFW